MCFDGIPSWLAGGGESKGPSRRARLGVLPAAVMLAVGLQAAAGPLPVAPPPREAKPVGVKIDPAQLVGSWQLTKLNGFAPNGGAATIEFGADGAVSIRAIGVKDGEVRQEGKYLLDGHRLHLTTTGVGPQPRSWTVFVEKLTPAELVFVEEQESKDRMGFTKLRRN